MPDDTKNQIRVDYTNNPKLAELFSRCNVGDKKTIEIEFQVVEKTPEFAKGTISKVYSDDYDDEDAAEPEPDKPMAIEVTAPSEPMPA